MKTFLHFCKFFLGFEQPHSQVTEDELKVILEYSRDKHLIVEIGCYEGKTTAALALHTSGEVFSIDPFPEGKLGICYGEWIAKIHCRRNAVRNVRFVKGYSFDVAQVFNKAIDFLFIDADHRYEGIKRDWIDWFPKVQIEGIIAVHDCKPAVNSPIHLGSMRFYEEVLVKNKLVTELESIDSLVVFKKIKLQSGAD